MKLEQIKEAIKNGKRVFWVNEAYEVKKCENGEYLIVCNLNQNCIGLTWRDEITMNGKEEEFFIK